MRGIKKKIYDEKIQHAAQILEIENLLDRKPKALSEDNVNVWHLVELSLEKLKSFSWMNHFLI